jgi:putative hydrolase of the HAD superfamily
MFEDLPRNLLVPHRLGMATVLVVPEGVPEIVEEALREEDRAGAHVDFLTDHLAGFLGEVASSLKPPQVSRAGG